MAEGGHALDTDRDEDAYPQEYTTDLGTCLSECCQGSITFVRTRGPSMMERTASVESAVAKVASTYDLVPAGIRRRGRAVVRDG